MSGQPQLVPSGVHIYIGQKQAMTIAGAGLLRTIKSTLENAHQHFVFSKKKDTDSLYIYLI